MSCLEQKQLDGQYLQVDNLRFRYINFNGSKGAAHATGFTLRVEYSP